MSEMTVDKITEVFPGLGQLLTETLREMSGPPEYYWHSTTPRASWEVAYTLQKVDDAYVVELLKRESKHDGPYSVVKSWRPKTRKTRDAILKRLEERHPPEW